MSAYSRYRQFVFDRYRRWPVVSVPVFLLLFGCLLLAAYRSGSAPWGHELIEGKWYPVERIVDGDTLLLQSGHRLRLQGVNTPETKHPQLGEQPGGKQATTFTTQWIGTQPVQLLFDREKKDHYGRYLVYVVRGEQCLNTELIRAGWSVAQLRLPISASWKKEFTQAEAEAQKNKAGLWNESQFPKAAASEHE